MTVRHIPNAVDNIDLIGCCHEWLVGVDAKGLGEGAIKDEPIVNVNFMDDTTKTSKWKIYFCELLRKFVVCAQHQRQKTGIFFDNEKNS